MTSRRIGLLALATLLAAPAVAEPDLTVSGGITAVGQVANDDRLDEAATSSADLTIEWSRGRTTLVAYVEGNASLDDDAISTLIVESNADAGTALAPGRRGRLQLSELKLNLAAGRQGVLTVGLLDPSAYLDSSRIDNDENLQFLGASFVNNPTIVFPDYTIGTVWERPALGRAPKLALIATSSYGLADGPDLSYDELLDVIDDDKGAFLGLEADWSKSGSRKKAGGWLETSPHERLDGSGTDTVNYGVFAVVGHDRGPLAGNLRLGFSNPEVNVGNTFAALTGQWDLGRRVLGLGIARTWLSSNADVPGRSSSTQIEGYMRFQVGERLQLTPSLQYLENSGLDSSAATYDRDVVVTALRLHVWF